MRKITHKNALTALNDILIEAQANSESGDTRLAASGRQTLILANILLAIVSNIPKEDYNRGQFLTSSKAAKQEDDPIDDAGDEKEPDNMDTGG